MCTFLRKDFPVTSKSFEAWPNSNLLILHLDINIYHLDIGAMNTFNEPVWYQVLRESTFSSDGTMWHHCFLCPFYWTASTNITWSILKTFLKRLLKECVSPPNVTEFFLYFGCTDTFGLLWELSRKGNSSLRQHLARVKGNSHDFLALGNLFQRSS